MPVLAFSLRAIVPEAPAPRKPGGLRSPRASKTPHHGAVTGRVAADDDAPFSYEHGGSHHGDAETDRRQPGELPLKSTGPRTEAGKAASSANALSHGLTAASTVVLPEEDTDAFERLRQGVIADLEPAGALQEALGAARRRAALAP